MLRIIEKTKIWLSISLCVIAVGLFFLVKDGLNFGIDFRGGTSVVIEMGQEFDKQPVENLVRKHVSDAVTNTVDGTKIEIRSNNFDSTKVSEMFAELKETYNLTDEALLEEELIGAAIGRELTNRALIALTIATFAMLLYVAVRFEIKFGIAAIIALIHDVLITLSVYTILQIPVNSPFIAAMLTIIGYSINDTIVVFDRIRENLKTMRRADVTEVANISVTQTLSRSINTTLTTLITIVAVYFFVPSVRDFAFPIIIGILSGSYSSIFIASPVWVMLKKRNKDKLQERKIA
jgi:preprotein translocase subunit SecF